MCCFSFKSQNDPEYIEYLAFSDAIEAIFTTKELEKMPLLEPRQFKPAPDDNFQPLTGPALENMLDECISRIAEKVCQTELIIIKLYQDVKNDTVYHV